MKKAILLFIFQLCSLAMFAQINTDRVLTIGRNALYFEDYVLSIQYFNQVIKSKPWLAEPYFYRAVAKINLDDYKGAEEDCTLCLERNPFLVQAYYARGIARQSQEKFDESNARFKQNGYIAAKAEYAWYDPRRYIVMNQARRFGNICQKFGWKAWISPCECAVCEKKRRKEKKKNA